MIQKQTLGPWAWRLFGDTYSLVADHGMREIIIGAIPHDQMKYPVVAMNLDGRLQDVDPEHPNAKLIANAPEMLKALDKIIEAREKATSTEELYEVLQAIQEAKLLIAKIKQ